MTNRQLYLAAYDISCNLRFRKALYVLRGFASGGQKSVFECFLTPAEKAQLLEEISLVIDPVEDRFILLKLAGTNHIRTFGKAVPSAGWFVFLCGVMDEQFISGSKKSGGQVGWSGACAV